MARPERNTVDYFPFMCDEGKKMFYIEENYGNDGFAVFIKLLRELAKTEFHYLDLNNKTTFMFLAAKCKVSKELFERIINDLVELEKLDSELWVDFKVIWCQDFIDSIQDAYKKRSNNCIDKNTLRILLLSKSNPKPSKSTPKPPKCESEVPVKPQSKVEYNKLKDKKTLLSQVSPDDFTEGNAKLYFTITKGFYDQIKINLEELEVNSNHLAKAKYITWTEPIRLLVDTDKYKIEEIREVLRFLKNEPYKEKFMWRGKILSTVKLREKFETLLIQSKINGKHKINNEKSKSGNGQQFKVHKVTVD